LFFALNSAISAGLVLEPRVYHDAVLGQGKVRRYFTFDAAVFVMECLLSVS
jgi:hypothetical protein